MADHRSTGDLPSIIPYRNYYTSMLLLIKNDWLQLTRRVQQQPIQVVSYAFVLLLLVNVYTAGISFGTLLQNNPTLLHKIGLDQPAFFSVKAIVYWVWLDLLIRLLLQPLAGLNVPIYKRLPFPVSTLINYLFCKNLISLYSIYPFLLLFSFYPFAGTQIWTLFPFVCLGIALNTNLVFLIKSRSSGVWLVSLVALSGICLCYDNFVSTNVLLTFLLPNTLFFAVCIACFIAGLYALNFQWIRKNLYVDAFSTQPTAQSINRVNHFTEGIRFLWSLVELDVKLILRNRRPRQYFLANATLSIICITASINDFSTQPITVFHFVLSSVLGGFVLMSHQQLMFGWEGSYFDGLLARPVSIEDLLRSKRTLFVTNCLLVYSVWLPFVWGNSMSVLLLVCCLLFNVGVNANILLFLSILNRSTIDLSKKTFFNYQGMNGAQFIGMILITGVPVCIMLGMQFITHSFWAALIATGGIGALCLLFRERILQTIVQVFTASRYHLAEGFRETRP